MKSQHCRENQPVSLQSISGLLIGLICVLIVTGCGGSKEILLDSPEASAEIAANLNEQPPNDDKSLKVVVLAHTSAADTLAVWQPILDYLAQETGHTFELWPTLVRDMFQVIENDEVDFVMSNPLSSVQMQRLYNTKFLATNVNGVEGSQFGGVIIAKRDSNVRTLADLEGKRGMSMQFQTAAGGYAYQTYLMAQNGFDPHQSFSKFDEANSQNDIVLAVDNGTTDVGFVRTGQLEKMAGAGLIDIDEFTIVEQIDNDHPYLHSTRLYPEWAFAALPHVDPVVAQQVKSALLALTEDHPSITTSRTVGFVEPLDYKPIDDLIETLQLPTWDAS